MQKIFFFQTQQIPNDTILFNQLKEQKIFYSYFQVDNKYYLFLYGQQQQFIHLDLIYQSVEVIEELDSKQRKIRSLRGFFLYACSFHSLGACASEEIIQNGENYEILKTNLQPFFWRKVKNIIRQNKKTALQEFLFGKNEVNQNRTLASIPHLQDQIKALNNQVDSLQQKVFRITLHSKLFKI